MLRRKPTSITLTTEDISTYEDTRLREAQAALHLQQQALHQQQKAQLQAQKQKQQGGVITPNRSQNLREIDPSDELRPLPGERERETERERVKSREERLGISRGGGGGGGSSSRG